MINKYLIRNVILISLIIIALGGCDNIIEPDISNTHINLITPADSSATVKISQVFRWDNPDNVRSYQLQIASPSFDNPSQFYLDTTTSKPSLRLVLVTGKFQWRVRGVNSGYKTQYSTRSFRIDTSSNLALQDFQLNQPVNGKSIASSNVTFQWDNLPSANYYVLNLLNTAYKDTIYNGNSFSLSLPSPTDSPVSYTWQVTAINKTSKNISNTSGFTIVKMVTPPPLQAPTLTSPIDGSTFSTLTPNINFSWQRNISNPRSDSLFIFKTDQSTLLAPGIVVNGTSYNYNLSSSISSGTYYWAVKSVDNSNNFSPLSTKRRFIIQ